MVDFKKAQKFKYSTNQNSQTKNKQPTPTIQRNERLKHQKNPKTVSNTQNSKFEQTKTLGNKNRSISLLPWNSKWKFSIYSEGDILKGFKKFNNRSEKSNKKV